MCRVLKMKRKAFPSGNTSVLQICLVEFVHWSKRPQTAHTKLRTVIGSLCIAMRGMCQSKSINSVARIRVAFAVCNTPSKEEVYDFCILSDQLRGTTDHH